MKLWIISNCRPNSGWGTYGANLYYAVGDRARFVNLFGSSSFGDCVGENALISGNSRFRPVLARIFPKLYFNALMQSINEERKNGLIVHFAYNLLPLIGNQNLDIITIHDLIFLSKWYLDEPRLRRIYSKHLIKGYLRYRNIIADSWAVKKQLVSFSNNLEIEVISPPCSTEFKPIEVTQLDKKKLNLPTDKILILSPSNDKPWKNLTMVSRVMKKLGDKFVLVRIGPDIGTGIAFNGVDGNTLNLLYNISDVLLFPSLEEGFGFPIVEAMRAGLPAVVSDIEVFHEIGCGAVEYVNPFDVDSIITGIFRALDNSEKLRNSGFQRAELYSLETFKKKLCAYYDRIAERSTLID